MFHSIKIAAFLAIVGLAILGCSHSSSNPIQSSTGATNPSGLTSGTGRVVMGIWSIGLSPNRAPIVKLNRTISYHESFLLEPGGGQPGPMAGPNHFGNTSPGPCDDTSPDYHSGLSFKGYVVWHITIRLINNLHQAIQDVRGIAYTGQLTTANNPSDESLIGVHNADGLTTIWDDPAKGDDKNPFRYYGQMLGNSANGATVDRTYDLMFGVPTDPSDFLRRGMFANADNATKLAGSII